MLAVTYNLLDQWLPCETFLRPMRPRSSSQLVIGSFVRLVPDGPVHRVIWRGKQTMPRHSDWPGEIAVYRLDYWDCYYEYQLLLARLWDNIAPGHQMGS